MKIINFRVDDAEHALMHAIAKSEGLSLTAYIRRHFMVLGRELGLGEDPLAKLRPTAPEPSAPVIERRPIPSSGNVWAYDVHARKNAGESFADIAASYGVDVAIIKGRYKFAEEQMEAGHKTPVVREVTPSQYTPAPSQYTPAPELVYAPVDPENPTEEEQAINAEIARRKLEAMGFTL